MGPGVMDVELLIERENRAFQQAIAVSYHVYVYEIWKWMFL